MKYTSKMLKKHIHLLICTLVMTAMIFAAGVLAWATGETSDNADRIPILAYHRFCTTEQYKDVKSARSLYVTTDQLEAQMSFLKEAGYRTISVEEFEAWHSGEIELPRKSVMITIDDGWYSSIKYALPIFDKYDIKSTVFLIGNRTEEITDTTEGEENQHSIGMDLIDKIQEEHPDFDIQSHGYDMHHYTEDEPVGKVIGFSSQQCFNDLRKQSELFGFSYLAYPFGTYTDTLINAIKDEGSIRIAFTYGNNRYATREQSPYNIERIKISGKEGMADFTKWFDEGEPILTSLQSDFCDEKFETVDNTLTFKSAYGEKYVVMRKSFLGAWKELGTVVALDEETSYVDRNIPIGKWYRYTVKRVLSSDADNTVCTPYNRKGLKMLTKYVKPEVNYTNRTAELSFTRNILVDGYKVYRKDADSEYEFLTDKNQRKRPTVTYTDVYISTQEIGNITPKLTFRHFIDPSRNDLVYAVRSIKKYDDAIVLGPMLPDGDFNITNPNIVSVHKSSPTRASVRFGICPNASRYIIYSGVADEEGVVTWNEVGEATGEGDGGTITADVDIKQGDDCFAVKAEYKKNGETLYSGMEETYTTRYRQYKGTRMLVIGASGSYGCPYKNPIFRFLYSYPYRMGEMLGATVDNMSIPGATYSTAVKGRSSILVELVNKVENGQEISRDAYAFNVLNRNFEHRTLSDYDIVLVVAGGNDYNTDLEPGTADSKDTATFAGAVNAVMDKLVRANEKRIAAGKKEIAVVMIGTTYSNRKGNFSQLNNRYEKANKIGCTLMDYENAFNAVYKNYKSQGMNVFYLGSEAYLNAENCSTATTDNLHMTRCTNGEFGAYLAKEFAEQGMLK